MAVFMPVRGKEERILNTAISDGQFLIATDSGKMFLDANSSRVQIGGAGVQIFYGEAEKDLSPDLTGHYNLSLTDLEDTSAKIEAGDIIINSDGRFYRVVSYDKTATSYQLQCILIAVSGNGSSSSSGSIGTGIDLHLENNTNNALINGQDAYIYFTATSATDKNGNAIDDTLYIDWTLASESSDSTSSNRKYGTTYESGTFSVVNGVLSSFNFGARARESCYQLLTLTARQLNSSGTSTRQFAFVTSELSLDLSSSFSNRNIFDKGDITIQYEVVGNMEKAVCFYLDDALIGEVDLASSSNTSQSQSIATLLGNDSLTYGAHKIKMELYQLINDTKGEVVESLDFEVAYYDGTSQAPIIWLGDHQDQYYQYDNIIIPYKVYVPNYSSNPSVHLFKDDAEVKVGWPREFTSDGFANFQIADAEIGTVKYALSCTANDITTKKEFSLTIVKDTTRSDFHIQSQSLLALYMNSKGRSNTESSTNREILWDEKTGSKVKINNVKFEDFNWVNNGWIEDSDGNSCLRISNGAKLSIPLATEETGNHMVFGNNLASEGSHTFEFEFKIRNVQNYASLITNITRYKYGNNTDDSLYEIYSANTAKYNSYDAFLTNYLQNNKISYTYTDSKTKETITKDLEYDDLEYWKVVKTVDLSNVVASFLSSSGKNYIGIALGAQDAFFSNGTQTINVSYVEDELINLSIVYDKTNNLMSIYINGILTGIVKNNNGQIFTVDNNTLTFISDNCDIDLYKIRVYNTALSIKEVVINYAFDLRDTLMYDQSNLTSENSAISELQLNYSGDGNNNMLYYNTEKYPKAPLMPYIIFDTRPKYSSDNLPYKKTNHIKLAVQFVNPWLDLAYTNGELTTLATYAMSSAEKKKATEAGYTYEQWYYMHHCPSWIGEYIDMAVQGTSSEFYPRRNYKIKTKTEYGEDGAYVEDEDAEAESKTLENEHTTYKTYIHMRMNKGPFQQMYENENSGEYILSEDAYDSSQTYYTDEAGSQIISFTNASQYIKGKYYIKNADWTEFGKEKTRLSYFYFNNYECGTTKFTMKIDYMESSGTYNMGFANLVANAYSKHPLDDLKKEGLTDISYSLNDYELAAGDFDADTSYYKPKKDKKTGEITKYTEVFFYRNPDNENYGKNSDGEDFDASKYYVKKSKTFPTYTGLSDTSSYRTSVQGFRTMAFHLDSNGTYTYIGMYNMLLDKGADEAYGFKPDKTTGDEIGLAFLKNKKVSSKAECWEFENNARTYCSFRDPQNRKVLSFDVPPSSTNSDEIAAGYALNSVKSGPVVLDSFEYRYHKDSDALDYIANPSTNGDKLSAAYDEHPKYEEGAIDETSKATDCKTVMTNRKNIVLKDYENWEKAVQWVWSTDTDSVASQGEYKEVKVGDTEWNTNTIYYTKNDAGEYVVANSFSEDVNIFYYTIDSDGVATRVALYKQYSYEVNTYYTLSNGSYYLSTSSDFDINTTYYILSSFEEADLAKKADRLVVLNADPYNKSTVYYSFDGTAKCNNEEPSATKKLTADECFELVENIETKQIPNYYHKVNDDYTLVNVDDFYSFANVSEEEFVADTYYIKNENQYELADVYSEQLYTLTPPDDTYYLFKDNLYVGDEQYGFLYDTKEYRIAKFVNELEDHFDIEYMATYFIMTEVFECYDSRGKNCMMASWGPHKNKGNYIWYPIFYDIDTQLGINNTGIPSFEYNIDATEEKTFSTSDSILWNNFYNNFKTSKILEKYRQLRGDTTGITYGDLKICPLQSVDTIESWYLTDPYCSNNSYQDSTSTTIKIPDYEKMGDRPLIAVNLDEYYKYITITNKAGLSDTPPTTGYVDGDGGWTSDDEGTYFYALQGDRTLSRKQFLTNRLEYIDSWLNQGNYSRGGANRITGRVAANNADNTSDIWCNDGYYNADGTKKHQFDAEYWVNLTPIRSAYVTLGDDNEAYPSKKYDGATPVKFEIDAISSGVMNSNKYPEQLLYIYGMNQMKDLGDMSNLYWQEFKITGNATKLTSLKLGYDGLMVDSQGNLVEVDEDNPSQYTVEINGKKYYYWFNGHVNSPSIPASKEDSSGGMPLLKEVNLSNININEGSTTVDLTSCEKLESFRATGSSFQQILFADGVALKQLYLPSGITALQLNKANLLTNLLTSYTYPTYNVEEKALIAKDGLYIEDFFDGNATTNINNISIQGGNLGYGTYKILNQYYNIYNGTSKAQIVLDDVVWSPYTKLVEGDEYDSSQTYFIDDGHFGLTEMTDYNADTWTIDVKNGKFYKYVANEDSSIIDDAELFVNLISNSKFIKDNYTSVPEITGIVYINNDYKQVQASMTYLPQKYSYFTDANGENLATEAEFNADNTKLYYIINEKYVRDVLVKNYPNLTFFFKTIYKNYTANYVYKAEDGTITILHTQTLEDVTDTFDEPTDAYRSELTAQLEHYDFKGWSTDNINVMTAWDGSITEGIYTYTYYAVYEKKKYTVRFYRLSELADSYCRTSSSVIVTVGETVGEYAGLGMVESVGKNIEDGYVYKFIGWYEIDGSDSKNRVPFIANSMEDVTVEIIDLATTEIYRNMYLCGVYVKAKVTDNVYPDHFAINDDGQVLSIDQFLIYTDILTLPEKIDDITIREYKTMVPYLSPMRLKKVYFENPNATTSLKLAENMFIQHATLTYFEMPTNITEIPVSAFQGLNKLNIQENFFNNITSIGENAFACTEAAPNTTTSALYFKNNITIGANAFANYTGVKTLEIGTSGQTLNANIDKDAFTGCSFSNVTIYGATEALDCLTDKAVNISYSV